MNIKIPAYVNDAIERVARDLQATKTDVVIALLNEGLTVASEALGGWEPPKNSGAAGGRPARKSR